MSTAESTEARTRRTPGLVPVAETLSSAERRPAEPVPPLPPARRPWAFWRLLGSELELTFKRPRNLAMLAVVACVPVIVGITLWIVAGDEAMGGLVVVSDPVADLDDEGLEVVRRLLRPTDPARRTSWAPDAGPDQGAAVPA